MRGNMRGLQRSQAIVVGLMLVVRLSSDVVFQPTFGHPLIHTDRIVFTTVDGKSLIGIDKDGTQKWKIRFPGRVNVNRWDENTLLVQSGQQVFQIDVRQGAQSKLITMPKYQYLGADALDHSFFMAIDSRFDHYRVQILDPTSHAPIWESSAIENILHLTPDLVVAVTAERVIERHGYSLRNG